MKVDWFQRGCIAFTEGHPCFIRDARISSKDRAAWYAGWNHQKNTNTLGKLTPEERAELATAFGEILSSIRSLP